MIFAVIFAFYFLKSMQFLFGNKNNACIIEKPFCKQQFVGHEKFLIPKMNKKALLIVSLLFPPLIVAGAAFTNSSFSITRATNSNVVLDSSNSPTLSSGAGTITDAKGVVWNYYNASDYASGHVSIGHQGYVSMASITSTWGYTGIEELTVDFSATANCEFWLLKSVDGVEWHEVTILTSNTSVTSLEGWRYVKLYNYTTDSTNVDINSVSISFTCSGVTSSEDVDSARDSNVITTTGLDHSVETSTLSPRTIDNTEAVRFTKTGSGSTDLTLAFSRTYTLGETAYSKIEFDIWTQSINYGRTIEVINTDGSYTSTKVNTSNTNAYIWTSLGDNWYHVELPITVIVSLISGYDKKDLPAKNVDKKTFNAIKINAGNCVIDNLRIGSSQCNLGIYNSTTYKPSVGEIFWVKTSWVGKLYADDVSITFDDDTLARRIPLTDPKLKNGSPFYIELLGTGTVTVYVSVVCGYDHHTQTISKTVTVK